MNENNYARISNFKEETNPIGKKLLIIVVFLLLLLIPLFCVENTVKSRADFKKDAINNIAASWAGEQQIKTPRLVLKNQELLILEDYNVETTIKTEYRKRGIFKIPVYIAEIKMSGIFDNPNLSTIDGTLEINVLDTSGFVTEKNRIVNNIPNSGKVYIKNAPKKIMFENSFTLRGLNSLSFETTAINNNIKVDGNWKNTSFEGDFLPSTKNITKNGFSANWSILGCRPELQNELVKKQCDIMFLTPIDSYRMTIRTIKYGFLFLSLTFLAFFLFETASRIKPIHPFQYTLIGFSMIIFYMLLLSLSEFMSFGFSYLIAVIMTIGLITGYTYYVLTNKDSELAKIITLIIGILYVYLYTVLNLQDFALLIGSLGLFIAIIAIMYYTRNIKWYKDNNNEENI